MTSGTNVGNLNATLTLSAWEFANGLSASKDELGEFARRAEQESKRASDAINNVGKAGGLAGGGGARMLQQVGFGIQDFWSQMANSKTMVDGLGRGISAVSNNAQMLGAAFGPTGMAVTAIGAAVAGIVLPAAIKWMYNTEELEKTTKTLSDHYDNLADRAKFLASTRLDDPKGVVSRASQLEKEAKIAQENLRIEKEHTEQLRKQFALAEMRIRTSKSGHSDLQADASDPRYQDAVAERDSLLPQIERANARRVALETQERIARQKLNDIQPEVDNANSVEKFKQDFEQYDKIHKQELKAQEAVAKFKQDSLEKYGSESDKISARQSRERADLDKSTMGNADALGQLDKQHAVETAKLRISEKEKYLSSSGKDAGMSAGIDVNSSDGISAINRAISGQGEQSVGMQQLEVQRKQLAKLEEIASGRTPAQDTIKDKSESLNSTGQKKLGLMSPERASEFLNSGPGWNEQASGDRNRGVYDVLAARRNRDEGSQQVASEGISKTLSSKRERESKASEETKQIVKILQEQKAIQESLARKPVSRVVALSGS